MRPLLLSLCFISLLLTPLHPKDKVVLAGQFPSRPITWIVPHPPGGLTDLQSREVAKSMSEKLGVSIFVKNVPGDRGAKGLMTLWNSKPDGYLIAALNVPSTISLEKFSTIGRSIDLRELGWIGRISKTPYFWTVRANSDYRDLTDLQRASAVRIPIPNFRSTSAINSALSANVMGFRPKFIAGYPSGMAATMALVRGEIDGGPWTLRLIDERTMRPLWIYSSERDPRFPDTPSVAELGYPSLTELAPQLAVAGPPGISRERLAILQQALVEAMKDSSTQAELREMDTRASLLVGRSWTRILDELTALIETNKAAIDELRR